MERLSGTSYTTPEHNELRVKAAKIRRHIDKSQGEERQRLVEELRETRAIMLKTPCTSQTDKTIKYVRYADDFLIGVKGSREDCGWIKSKLAEFIGGTLKMELSSEKTLITHSSEFARFLGYDINVRRSGEVKRGGGGGKGNVTKRTLNNHTQLVIPLDDKIHKFIFSKGVAKQKQDGTLFPIHRNSLLKLTDLEIVSAYNAELRGICNYYGMASNYHKLKYFVYLMKFSCLKTLAAKHKSSISKVVAMFADGKSSWGIPYETKQGKKRCYFANYADCKGTANATDVIKNVTRMYNQSVTTLEMRLKAEICELCGTTESDHYEIHHVNKLKNLKGKQQM